MVTLMQGDKAHGRVHYTNNLDSWDGHDFSAGGMGSHLGIGKTKTGLIYAVHGSNWEGGKDWAEVIDREDAKQLLLTHDADPELYLEIMGEPIPILDE